MSITHNLETLTDKQKSDLELAQTLSNNIDSLKPSHVNKISLTYNGERFHPITGYLNRFLVDDIHLAIEADFEKHKSFMIETVRSFFKDYDSSNKSNESFSQLEMHTTAFLKYYGFNSNIVYPLYLGNSEFKVYLEDLDKSIKKGLAES
ncbi:hypothetical protein [Tenacibaculum sp. 47A_GOM-205m]|uniref:hypothetical protein n=1 Tax=Tenacibaculum sp. 47A_GOM-205m TaxID=1380384 RepID=UPI00049181F3|nr:hypothetical protein [Tenacibaculum sp. 47A_GOM-205m]